MCKKVVFVVFLYLSTMFAYSQATVDNVIYNHKCIALRQNFKGEGSHCMPSFGYSEIYYNVTEDVLKDILSEMIHNTGPFPINISEHLRNHLSEYVLNNKIEEYNIIIPIHLTFENDNFFNNDDTIKKITVRSYIDNMENDGIQTFNYCIKKLKIGENKLIERASDPCYNKWNDLHGGHRNSYTLTTSLIYDVPISVEITNTKTDFNIDKNDKVRLKFGDFYKQANDEVALQYQINDSTNNKWKDIATTVPISPNGEVEFMYGDIIQSDDYDKGIGKFIAFRVIKKMVDGTYASANESNNCRFYLSVPDFTIVESRRPACDDTPLQLLIKVDDNRAEIFNNLLDKTNCKIKIVHDKDYDETKIFNKDGTAFYLSKIKVSDPTKNIYSVSAESTKKNGPDLEQFLREDPDATKGLWKIQIEMGDNLYAAEQSFTMPAKLPSVKLVQDEKSYLFKQNDIEIHLYSKQNPYVVLKNNTESEDLRFPYYIHNNVAPEGDKFNEDKALDRIDFEIETYEQMSSEKQTELEKSFNANFPYQVEHDKFIKQKVKKWYEDNKSTTPIKVRTFKRGYVEKSPELFNFDNSVMIMTDVSENPEYILYSYTPFPKIDISSPTNCTVDVYKFAYEKNAIMRVPFEGGRTVPGGAVGISKENNGKMIISLYGGNPAIFNCNYNFYPEEGKAMTFLCSSSNCAIGKYENLLYYIYYANGAINVKKMSIDGINDFIHSSTNINERYGNCYLLTCNNKIVKVYDISRSNFSNNDYVPTPNTYTTLYSATLASYNQDGTITYNAKNGNTYKQLNSVPTFDTFYEYFKNEQTLISSQEEEQYESDWEIFRDQQWNNYKLKNAGYHVKIPEANLNNEYTLYVYDSDGCLSEVKYTVNVLDGPTKETTEIQKPTTSNSSDGKATIRFVPGGDLTYYYNGETLNQEENINVEGLHWGDNVIVFTTDDPNITITHTISILPEIELSSSPQTCKDLYGSISLSGGDFGKLPSFGDCIRYYPSTGTPTNATSKSRTNKIPIKEGKYKVDVKMGDWWCNIGEITIDKKIFAINNLGKCDATEIGGTGNIEVSTTNVQGNITWENAPSNYNSTEHKFLNVPAKVYDNISVIHTYNNETCPIALGRIEIQSPKINFTKAEITYNENTKKATFDIISSGNNLIDNYTLYLTKNVCKNINDVTTYKVAEGINKTGEVSFTYENTLYYLYVVYANNSKIKLLTGNGIEPPTLGNKCNAVADANNSMRCYGTDGIITLTGEDCEYSTDGGAKYKPFSNNGKISLATGSYTIDFRKISTADLNYCSAEDTIKQITQTTIKTIKNVTITEALPLEYDIIAPNIKCHGADGTISIKVTANAHGDVVFAIRNDDGTISDFSDSITNLSPNIYNIVIQDGYCKDYPYYVDSIEISQPDEPLEFKSITTTDPTCWNDDGKIEVVVKGGWNEYKGVAGGYYNIVLDEDPQQKELEESSFNSTENVTFEGLEHKDYTIYATDYENCTISKDVTLYKYVNPKITGALFDSVWCYGGNNGNIKNIEFTTDDQVSDGDPMKMYYSTNPAKPSVESNWIDYSPTINNLKSDDYYIWLKDTNQCVSDDYYDVHVAQPDPLKISIIHQDTIIHEYGKKGGTVEVLVAGGNKGRFNIYIDSIVSDSMVGHAAWDIHETFKDIFMPDTTHKLYVQDHKECTDSVITGFMRQPDSPLMVEGIPHPAWCNGAEGSIKIIAKGGWGKYRYSCNLTGDTVAMRQPFDSVAASLTSDSIQVGGGLYVLTLIDSAGVMVYDTVLVTTPPALKADNLSRAAYCGSDGVIAVDISGGTAPYKIENDFGQETFRTAGGITAFSKSVPAGSYTVYIKDTNDCRFNVPVSIADSSVVVSIKRQYPTMRQYANGRLEAVAQRGHAPYTFLWTNRNTGETCANAVWNNVMAGTYSLVVSDGSGCEKDGEIAYLATNGDLPLTIDAVEGETAPNAKNGWARFTSDTSGFSKMMLHSALGGDIDVIGNISNQLNFELTGLAPDSYVLECMLPEGEVRYVEFTIAKYEPIVLLVNNINHASQPDASDGSATLQITGGVAPYVVQMLHNDVFYDDTVLNGRQLVLPQLSAGTYAAIVIDKYGKCENTRFIIKEPDSPMQLTAESVQSPSCYGYSNGQIWLKAQGGWGDYEYALAGSDYSRTTMYGNRSAESYTFIAIDAKGVTDTLTVELSQPEPLRAGVAKVDSVSCFGLFDGGVTFDITGGTAPYYVEFDSLFTKPGNYIGSLNGGLHTFRFTDDKMCASDDDGLEVDVPQPEKLVIANDSVTPTTCNTDNGKIDIVIAGGIAPYTVKWKEDGLTVARLQGRTSIDSLQQLSLYSVVAVDANNCKTPNKDYRMNRSSGPRINKVLTLPVLCYGDATGTAVIDSADVIPATPYSPFRIEWPNGQNAMSVNDLTAGWNEVFVIDSNNCKSSTGFNVDAPSPVEIRKIGSKDATCYGYADGRISTLTLGGVGSYHYLWNTGDTLPKLENIGKGSYTIMVTDRNNCHDSATYSIGQPDSLHVEIGEDSVLMCPDNTYEFTATAGFKTYSWSLNDSVLSTKRNLIASEGGEYYLEATYGKGCISRDTVTITIGDNLLEADFYMASDAAVDTSLALVELSNMQIDSLHWEFNYSDFVVVDSSDYELYLKPVNLGQHEITLWAYSGGCVSYKTKQVEISQLADTTHNINLGYNPLIKSVTVMPNPTRGQFSISVKLREEHSAVVMISSVGQGTPIERRDLSGKSVYNESFDLSTSSDGVYILKIVAGNEQRVVKVLLTK